MTHILIKTLEMSYFKGMKKQVIDLFDHLNNKTARISTIYGDNGTGKSTVADAFTWVLFGKNAEDRKQFSIKTYDENGKVIPRVPHEVTAVLDVDGEEITIKRVYQEKWTKRKGDLEETFQGHEETQFYNGVPCSKSEFDCKIAALCPEDVFKYITNPLYFTSQKPDIQRAMLFAIAGEVTDEELIAANEGFAVLVDVLHQKTLEEYKREVQAKKRQIKQDIDSYPARIEELNLSLPAAEDWPALEEQKKGLEEQNRHIDDELSQLAMREDPCKPLYEKIRELDSAASQRIAELRREHDEHINTLTTELTSEKTDVATKNSEMAAIQAAMLQNQQQRDVAQRTFDEAKKRYTEIRDMVVTAANIAPVCPTCGREFTEEEMQSKREMLIAEANQRKSEQMSREVNKAQAAKQEIARIDQANRDSEERKSTIAESIKAHEERIKAIEDSIHNFDKVLEEKSSTCMQEVAAQRQQYQEQITILQQSANNGADESLPLKQKRVEIAAALEDLNKRLANKERIASVKHRIDELMSIHSKAAQELAYLEGIEFTMQQFSFAKAEKMQHKVNALFKNIKFKLFDTQVNGAIVETCTATIKGVPYADANNAARINAGLEIIEILDKMHDVAAPIFIDNAESINAIHEVAAQQIRLRVSENPNLFVKLHN